MAKENKPQLVDITKLSLEELEKFMVEKRERLKADLELKRNESVDEILGLLKKIEDVIRPYGDDWSWSLQPKFDGPLATLGLVSKESKKVEIKITDDFKTKVIEALKKTDRLDIEGVAKALDVVVGSIRTKMKMLVDQGHIASSRDGRKILYYSK